MQWQTAKFKTAKLNRKRALSFSSLNYILVLISPTLFMPYFSLYIESQYTLTKKNAYRLNFINTEMNCHTFINEQ